MKKLTPKIQILLLVIGILLTLVVVSTGVTLSKMNRIGNEIKEITGTNIPLTEIITKITINQLEQTVWFERALRFAIEMKEDDEAPKNFTRAKEAFNRLAQLVDDEIKKGGKITEEAIKVAHTQESQRELEAVLNHLKVIEKEHANYNSHVVKIFEEITRGTVHEFKDAIEKIEAEEDRLDHELEKFLGRIEEFTEASILRTEHDEDAVILLMRGITIFALIFGITISIILITIGFNKPLIVDMDHTGIESKEIAEEDNFL